MAGTKKEEIESKNAVEAVKAADAKVDEIKAKKAADKAKRHEETLKKHPKIGSKLNWLDDNKWKIIGGVATGGILTVAGYVAGENDLFGFKKRKEAKLAAQAIDITPESESTEPPFEA